MADMEIVLPEKKNPSLTPMDWVSFLGSAIVMEGFGVSRVLHSKNQNFKAGDVVTGLTGWEEYSVIHNTAQLRKIQQDHDDENVPIPLSYHVGLLGMPGFTAYAGFYEVCAPKKGDSVSGKYDCIPEPDNKIYQEVKEVIISYFILMEQGKATLEDLDMRCEGLKKEEFGVSCNFDVDDAVIKLEKLGIVSRV
ncbi:hypothetical protein POM88_001410 [Heracleum sosnowskyi]|uniref:Oxidoreductase N-terminal domain-containing protein n=1 Tax=Heracleum sosnowskyi TaxID=360622 RepID=A0AAD8N4Y8_9APIA|nr:hypothetical protein POM88_001410 [Heracleum sosnowskyi]